MNNKTLSTYLFAGVAGLGLAFSSMAFAQNTPANEDYHAGMMGQTTAKTTQTGMHGQVTPTAVQNGMHSQAAPQNTMDGMHGQPVKEPVTGMHGSIDVQHKGAANFNSNAHCNFGGGNQDKKS